MDIIQSLTRLSGRSGAGLEQRPWLVLVAAAVISATTIWLGELATSDARSRLHDTQAQAESAAAVRASTRVSFLLADVADKLFEETRPNSALAAAAATNDTGTISQALRDAAGRVTYVTTAAYYFVDARGMIVTGWNTSAAAGPASHVIGQRADVLPWVDTPQSRIGSRFMTEEQLTQHFAGPELYLSDFFIPLDRSGVPMARGTATAGWRAGEERDGHRFAMAAKILDANGRFLGLLAVEITHGPFIDAVFELQGISQNAYLVERTGRLVRRMEFADKDELVGTDLSREPVVVQALKSNRVTTDADDPLLHTASVVATASVPDRSGKFGADLAIGWAVIAAHPLTTLYAGLDRNAEVLRTTRLGLVAALMIFAGLLTYAMRRVVRQRLALESANVSLDAAGSELAAATRRKSEFLANMSHELRTPLNAIIGFSDVLGQRLFGELNPKQGEYVQDISTSGRHLLALVNEILDLSKVEAGRMELDRSDFAVVEMIQSTVTFVRERAASHNVLLQVDVAPNAGAINADERKIRQVLLNLLSNAVKFTPEGGSVRVAARRDRDELTISVADTGVGIAFEDRSKVFEEFRQVGRSRNTTQEGTGLGLTLAKRFVELHGGRIWLESAIGKGSTFTFAIPIVVRAPIAATMS